MSYDDENFHADDAARQMGFFVFAIMSMFFCPCVLHTQ